MAVLAVLALVLRLWGLGARSMHYDEARVGYWTLRYAATGRFAYRPIIHGPFLPIVTNPVLEAFGPSDFAVRLVPAMLGGGLPLVALAFDDIFDDTEMILLAVILAFNPVLLYFSRFFRSDIPLAAFGFGAFALGARGIRTGSRRALLAASVLFGFALTTKENVLVYLGCWAGAVGIVFVIRFLSGGTVDTRGRPTGLNRFGSRISRLLPATPPLFVIPLVVAWFFYVPRGYEPGLEDLLVRPVPVLAAGTIGAWDKFSSSIWAAPGTEPYFPFLIHLIGTISIGGPLVYAAALYGTGVEMRRSVPRGTVLGASVWGFVSVVGYPLAADIKAPWLAVHILVPLSVPAAAGLTDFVRHARDRWLPARPWRGDTTAVESLRVILVLLTVLFLVTQSGFVVLATSYTTPPSRVNLLAQGAQPGDDLDPLARDIATAADRGGVLYYGGRFRLPNEAVADVPPRDGEPWIGLWVRRLPLSWYVERAGAEHQWAGNPSELPEELPPVVVADDAAASELAATGRVADYERREYDLLLYGGTVVVFRNRSLDRPA